MSSSSSSCSSSLSSPLSSPPKQPPHPYAIGASLIVKRHIPPPPFGRDYTNFFDPEPEGLESASQVEWCLSHPPTPGTTVPEDKRNITLVQPLRVGRECGAQVLLTDANLVAKIFDPLFYAFYDGEWTVSKQDVATIADEDYVIEAAAYQELCGTIFQGSIMPACHGSYTLDVPVTVHGEEKFRQVRMILIEYVAGMSMMSLAPNKLSAKARENIMTKLIEADTDLHCGGLKHDDLEPRNVILAHPTCQLLLPDLESFDLRVCLIDWNISIIHRIIFGKPPKYHNPLFYWTASSRWSSWGWLPFLSKDAWEWMWAVWADGRDGKYMKVERDPESPTWKPKRPD